MHDGHSIASSVTDRAVLGLQIDNGTEVIRHCNVGVVAGRILVESVTDVDGVLD